MNGTVIILMCICMNAAAQIMLKYAMQGRDAVFGDGSVVEILTGATRLVFSPLVFGALSLYVLGMLFWLYVLSRFDLSYAFPFGALGYVLLTIASWLLFKEEITSMRLVAIGLITAGIIVLARS